MDKLLNKHIKEIPYEGTEVDIEGLKDTIKDLLKGMITYSANYTPTTRGYYKDGKHYSRDEIVNNFLILIK